MNEGSRAGCGIEVYFGESARELLRARYKFPPFVVEFQESGSDLPRRETVTQIVAERIDYFGRCLAAQKNGAGSGRVSQNLHVVLFKTPNALRYLAYGTPLLGNLMGAPPGKIRDVELVHAL